jgi:hypothetical protein
MRMMIGKTFLNDELPRFHPPPFIDECMLPEQERQRHGVSFDNCPSALRVPFAARSASCGGYEESQSQ